MPIAIGMQLGWHEITALLGKGGMGEVYRARDTKLKRDIAIKILPDQFSRDADRVIRFQRESEDVKQSKTDCRNQLDVGTVSKKMSLWNRRGDTSFCRLFECIAEFDETRLAAGHTREADAEGSGLRMEAFRKRPCVRNQCERNGDRRVAGPSCKRSAA